ncbi:MAG: right-handed parallel beta-helix repeat-containing protein [Planctomycetota bacterium]
MSDSFILVHEFSLYGGFNGTESSLGARQGSAANTILSGVIDSNPSPPGNSLHILLVPSGVTVPRLDGFTIERANADSSVVSGQGNGGGLLLDGGRVGVLSNCHFRDNLADRGGAIGAFAAVLSIKNCTFHRNAARELGGAIWVERLLADATVTPAVPSSIFSSQFDYNYAGVGGIGGGGAIFFGGGSNGPNDPSDGPGLIYNCLFHDNVAINVEGGGAAIFLAPRDDSFVLVGNCTIANNTVYHSGSPVYAAAGVFLAHPSATCEISNSVLWDNVAYTSGATNLQANFDSFGVGVAGFTLNYSNIGGGTIWPGSGNISAVPNFVDSVHRDYKLLSTSPCIDAGNDTYIAPDYLDLDTDGDKVEPTPFELRLGIPRTWGLALPPAPLIPDMGCYEYRETAGP